MSSRKRTKDSNAQGSKKRKIESKGSRGNAVSPEGSRGAASSPEGSRGATAPLLATICSFLCLKGHAEFARTCNPWSAAARMKLSWCPVTVRSTSDLFRKRCQFAVHVPIHTLVIEMQSKDAAKVSRILDTILPKLTKVEVQLEYHYPNTKAAIAQSQDLLCRLVTCSSLRDLSLSGGTALSIGFFKLPRLKQMLSSSSQGPNLAFDPNFVYEFYRLNDDPSVCKILAPRVVEMTIYSYVYLQNVYVCSNLKILSTTSRDGVDILTRLGETTKNVTTLKLTFPTTTRSSFAQFRKAIEGGGNVASAKESQIFHDCLLGDVEDYRVLVREFATRLPKLEHLWVRDLEGMPILLQGAPWKEGGSAAVLS